MEGLTVQANRRDILGKKTRFLRRQGITPTHLFGHGLKSLHLQCDAAKLDKVISQAGMTKLITLHVDTEKQPRTVFIREIQRDVINGQLLHVDFYQVRAKEKIKADIPIVLVGEAPAMKLKRHMLTHTLDTLSIECLPDKMPPQIEVDLSPLEEAEQAIYVRDLVLSPDITVFTDPDQMVVKVTEVPMPEEEEVVAGAEAEEEAGEEAEETAGEETE